MGGLLIEVSLTRLFERRKWESRAEAKSFKEI